MATEASPCSSTSTVFLLARRKVRWTDDSWLDWLTNLWKRPEQPPFLRKGCHLRLCKMHPPTSPDEVSTSCSRQTHRHTQADVRHWACVFPPSPCTRGYGKNRLRLRTNIYIRQIPKAVSRIWDHTLLAVSDHHMCALQPFTVFSSTHPNPVPQQKRLVPGRQALCLVHEERSPFLLLESVRDQDQGLSAVYSPSYLQSLRRKT